MPVRCAVFGCDNQSNRRDRWVVMPHVGDLAFHGCHEKHYSKWTKLINRKEGGGWSGVNKHTKVCSNHFQLGKPLPNSPLPTLYMKGYPDTKLDAKRREPKEREVSSQVRKKKKLADPVPQVDKSEVMSQEDLCCEHSYSQQSFEACDKCSPYVQQLLHTTTNMSLHISQLEDQLKKSTAKSTPPSLVQSVTKKFTIDDIKDNDAALYMHTGVQNYPTFLWIMSEVANENMHYYRGRASIESAKNYQKNENLKKPGRVRTLSAENELLITLMRIKMNLQEDYLAFLFGVSESAISQIISTWIPLLSRELSGLVHWPTQEQVRESYPNCFKKYDTVRAIIDCTEVEIQKPSMASANSQIFSNYKNRPTAKFLLACTPTGTISFISQPAGGRMSDKELTASSGICDLFGPGDICMADRGFTIQDLLLPRGARLVMPPFTRKGKQFTPKQAAKTKTIANARIHIERVINRWKDFAILRGTIPLNMKDILGHIGVVCAALVNLLPSIVPE